MSARIKYIIEVIEEVRDNFRNRKGISRSSIRQMRINAGHSVASRWEITNQSVIDKFIRQLRPDIESASQFDSLLEKWLLNNSSELQHIILKHKSDKNDQTLISNAFFKAPEEDILLAEEFGADPNDAEFREGKEKLKIHLIKERNRHLVQLAKEQWHKENIGTVSCAICLFSFDETYGDIGKGYIEAHHILPVSSLTPDTIIKIGDLVPVCSNCHSIIHRYRPWLTIDQLRNTIRK